LYKICKRLFISYDNEQKIQKQQRQVHKSDDKRKIRGKTPYFFDFMLDKLQKMVYYDEKE
jgi:hypothetical protein